MTFKVENFLQLYVKKIVNHPELVFVERVNKEDGYEFIIHADSSDIGKIVGKDGKMITSIKAFITGCKAKDGKNYRVMAKALHA